MPLGPFYFCRRSTIQRCRASLNAVDPASGHDFKYRLPVSGGPLRSRLTLSMSNIQVRALKLLVACTSILRSGFEAELPDDQE
jgi:hypothetical protein